MKPPHTILCLWGISWITLLAVFGEHLIPLKVLRTPSYFRHYLSGRFLKHKRVFFVSLLTHKYIHAPIKLSHPLWYNNFHSFQGGG